MLRFWDILISGKIATPPPPFPLATTDQMTRPQLKRGEFRKEQLKDETLEKLCKTAVDDQYMYEVEEGLLYRKKSDDEDQRIRLVILK